MTGVISVLSKLTPISYSLEIYTSLTGFNTRLA